MSRGISIVVAAFNRGRILKNTLESLAGLKPPAGVDVEIMVIDNNSTDGTPDVIKEFASRCPFPFRGILETRQGHCHCRNRGFREASFDHVVDFDDDVQVSPGWITGYFDAIGETGADCIVGPVFPFFESELPDYVTQRIVDDMCSPYSRKGDRRLVLSPEVGHEIPGCNFGIRRSVAIEIGGFDPAIGRIKGAVMLSGDDFDFGARLVKAGKRVVYEPTCSIRHLISSEKLSKPYLRRRWYGEGATKKMFDLARGVSFSTSRILRMAVATLRTAAGVPWFLLKGQRAKAFEKELETRRTVGYLRRARPFSKSLPSASDF